MYRGPPGLGALGAAAEFGRFSVVKILLGRHCFSNCEKLNAACLAIQRGHVEVTRYLLEAGGRDAECYGQRPPTCQGLKYHYEILQPGLNIAVNNGHYDAVEFLLQLWNEDEDPYALQDCLLDAVKKGFDSLVRLLIARGAKVNEPTHPVGVEWQRRPMFVAMSNSQWHIVATLEELGGTKDDVLAIDRKSNMGTILHQLPWSKNHRISPVQSRFPRNYMYDNDGIVVARAEGKLRGKLWLHYYSSRYCTPEMRFVELNADDLSKYYSRDEDEEDEEDFLDYIIDRLEYAWLD